MTVTPIKIAGGTLNIEFIPDGTTPVPTPTPVPVPTPSNTIWVGTNLSEVRDYSTDEHFINRLLLRRGWISTNTTPSAPWDDGRVIPVDQNGNITSLATDQVARGILWAAQPRRAGTYFLDMQGDNTGVSLSGGVLSTTFTVLPDGKTKRIKCTIADDGSNVFLNVRAGTNSEVPKLLRFIHTDDLALADSGARFNPTFVQRMSTYGCIRFMDWAQTNSLRAAAQMERDLDPVDVFSTYNIPGQSVPLVTMIDLCNAAKTNGWFCVPYGASDSYIQRMIQLINSRLTPGLKAYIEHSNEIWNGAFPQSQAITRGVTWDEGMRKHARQSAKIATICAATNNSNIISVLGWWTVSEWWTSEFVKLFTAENIRKPDMLAIGSYVGHDFPDDPRVLTDGRWDAEVSKLATHIKAHVAAYGTGKVIAYEGSSHITRDPSGNIGTELGGGIACSRSPDMEGALLRLFQAWKNAGGGLFCHFTHIAGYSRWGSWGEREFAAQSDTPRSRAVSKAKTLT